MQKTFDWWVESPKPPRLSVTYKPELQSKVSRIEQNHFLILGWINSPEQKVGRVGNWRGGLTTPSPVPATSNGACGFPALRSPARFEAWVMRVKPVGPLSDLVCSHRSYSTHSHRVSLHLAYGPWLRSCRLLGCRSPQLRKRLNLIHVTYYMALFIPFISNGFLFWRGTGIDCW